MEYRVQNVRIGALLGVLVGALGLVVLLSWHLRVPILTQLHPSWVPMHYNTAIGFLCLGIALVALHFDQRRLVHVAAAIPLCIGAVTLLTWVFAIDAGIDQALMQHDITAHAPPAGRMSPNSAFAFVIVGGGLLVATIKHPSALVCVAWILGWVTIAIGAGGAGWTLIHAMTGEGDPVRFNFMALHAGLGFIAAGIALTLLTFRRHRMVPPAERIWHWPTVAAAGVIGVSLVLWQSLAVAEKKRLADDTRTVLEQLATTLQTESVPWTEAYARAARRIASQAATITATEWENEARDYFRGIEWLREIVWLNSDGSVHYRVARDPSEYLPDMATWQPYFGIDMPTAFGSVIRMILAQNVPSAGPLGFVIAPFATEHSGGAAGFTVRLDIFFATTLGKIAPGYDVAILDGDRMVYRRSASAASAGSGQEWVSQSVSAYGREWSIQVSPSSAATSGSYTWLPQVTLLFGVALALLLATALRFAGMARQRTSAVMKTRSLLEQEVEERRRAEEYARSREDKARRTLSELQQILNRSQDLICTIDENGCFLLVSASARTILGYRPEEMIGRNWREFVIPEDIPASEQSARTLYDGGHVNAFDNRYLHKNGNIVHLSWVPTWVQEDRTAYAIARDVTRRHRLDAIRAGELHILHLIATASPLHNILQAICNFVENIEPAAICSVVLLDESGKRIKHTVGPRLPPGYLDAMASREIGAAAGSSGTAMWRNERVIVRDVETDPLWADYLSPARQYGLRACWATPIMGGERQVLGSLAMYYFMPREPQPADLEMLESAAGLASVAIERERVAVRLEESRAQLEFARRLAQLSYWEYDLATDRVVMDGEALEMLGIDTDHEHTFSRKLSLLIEEDRPILLQVHVTATQDGLPFECEYRVRRRDGKVLHIHSRGRPVIGPDGGVHKVVGTMQDITARKAVELENSRLYAELEQRVQSRTRELEQSNRELEAFSYSVSHDLRAPLRAIAGFSALLHDEYGDRMEPQARHYLNRIVAGTVRMSALIDDLLELGRVNRVELVRQPLDLGVMAIAAAARLKERWPDRDVSLTVAPGLMVSGDQRLIEVVMENLLDNAWKFTSAKAHAVIRIGKKIEHGTAVFFVADNGVGFDPRYAANLFGVFQRLHATSAFPGTGVGLATVQRILQRHGGRIWADAKVGEGATFYFTVSEAGK